jgi:hypothetical protein
MSSPQTIADYGAYFFNLIHRQPGQPADDYAAVLSQSTIPAGLPPYVVPDASMPHHALTQQIGSDGRIAGRLFLPTATPDDLGYYSHPVSPLRDGPMPGSLLWEWRDLGGPPVVNPATGSGGGTTPPPADPQVEQRLETLEAQMETLMAQVAALETKSDGPFRAHGPVDLPIVLRSLTSLRALGDIDVAVTPGQATPPAASAADDDGGLAGLLRTLRGRDDDAPPRGQV